MDYRNASDFGQSLGAMFLGKAQGIREFSSWHFMLPQQSYLQVSIFEVWIMLKTFIFSYK